MKYALYMPNFGAFGDARRLASLAREAEDAGWDGFFLWDHVAGWPLEFVDPWVALAAIALATRSIRIGTTVTPLPRRRPWKLARETVSIDHLSDGRLILGVGIGGGDAEWGNFGEEENLKERGKMLDEALDVLTGLWSGELFGYQGQYYHIQEACFLPKPVQSPRIPVWVGGFWPHNKAPFRRAARWDGVFPLFQASSAEDEILQIKQVTAFIQNERAHTEGYDIACLGFTAGENRNREAEFVSRYTDAGATWWLEGLIPMRFGKDYLEDWQFEKMRQRVLQGPPSP
jgi:alkanesulfonate monooxygenase SsuD/methylene tetrahydromethanopterin reductase-like flavin-dependent oxidoreductase (luciferase family)